jgi:hypothetical protein
VDTLDRTGVDIVLVQEGLDDPIEDGVTMIVNALPMYGT